MLLRPIPAVFFRLRPSHYTDDPWADPNKHNSHGERLSLSASPSVLPSSISPSVLTSSTSSILSEDSPSSAATLSTSSRSARPSSNHIAVGVGIGVGVPVGLAILAGLAYLVRRRSNISDGRDEIAAYLNNKKELGVNQKVVHEMSEIAGGSTTLELSGQSVVEFQGLAFP